MNLTFMPCDFLTFIPSDFVNLSNPIAPEIKPPNDSTQQYQSCYDCPTIRALIRIGVMSKGADIVPEVYHHIYFNPEKLNQIRERLLSGEETVTIEIPD